MTEIAVATLMLMEPRDGLYKKLCGDLLSRADATKTAVLAQVVRTVI